MKTYCWLASCLLLTSGVGTAPSELLLGSQLPLSSEIAQAQGPVFTDVPADHWAGDYIASLTALNIIAGFPDGTFRPNEPVTRAQYAAIIRAFSASLDADDPAAQVLTKAPFSDVSADHWAAEAITTARDSGFLLGYPNNLFRPEQNIPRIQTLVALTNGIGYTNEEPPVPPMNGFAFPEGGITVLRYYSDSDNIPDYARSSAIIASRNGLVVNYPTLDKLSPNRPATRAEVAAFIHRALVSQNQADPLAFRPYEVASTSSVWQPSPAVAIFPLLGQPKLSYNGQRLVALSSGTASGANAGQKYIQVRNVQTEELIFEQSAGENAQFGTIAISPDGQRIAAVSKSQPTQSLELWLWDLTSQAPAIRRPLELPSADGAAEVSSAFSYPKIVFHPVEDKVLTYMTRYEENKEIDSLLLFHDSLTGDPIPALPAVLEGSISAVEFSPDGDLLAVIGRGLSGAERDKSVVDVWRLSSNDDQPLLSLRPRDELSFIKIGFTQTGTLKTLEKFMYDVRVSTWNVQTQSRIAQSAGLIGIDRQDDTFDFSPDGVHVFLRGDVVGTRMIDTQRQVFFDWPVYIYTGSSTFSGDGCYFAAATPEGIQVFSAECL